MSDDRRDDFQEYGSLFDESQPSGVVPEQRGGDDFTDDVDDDWDDGGFGDVTWADDGPSTVDPTDDENYQGPAEVSYADEASADVARSTSMFDRVDPDQAGEPDGREGGDFSGSVWSDDGRVGPASEEVDVWSSFNSEAPKWDEDGSPIDPPPRPESPQVSARQRRVIIDEESAGAPDGYGGGYAADEYSADRIRIATDSGPRSGSSGQASDRRGGRVGRAGDAQGDGRRGAIRTADSGGRDLPMAIGVGLIMVGIFVAALRVDALKYWGIVGVVTLVSGVAGLEFLSRVGDKGYRPALVPGVATCVAAPLVAYWVGDAGLPLVISFAFIAISVSFIFANSVDSAPLPNIAITNFAIVWIGLMASFAMLILRFSTANGSGIEQAQNYGTDTLFLLAMGVVVNDTGALLVGSFAGRTKLRSWISPNKTVEGLIGGALMTIISMIVYRQLVSAPSTWIGYRDLLILALTIAVMAPLGDLVESMLKRNMNIKDFGAVVPGHGGVLDRFDGFLLTLPAVYYLTELLQPWNYTP